jgi:hypothetical protein
MKELNKGGMIIGVLLAGVFSVIECNEWFTGITTRYWDCCKPSCAWPGKAKVYRPVETCYKNGSILAN